jgi:hypothetical protein
MAQDVGHLKKENRSTTAGPGAESAAATARERAIANTLASTTAKMPDNSVRIVALFPSLDHFRLLQSTRPGTEYVWNTG